MKPIAEYLNLLAEKEPSIIIIEHESSDDQDYTYLSYYDHEGKLTPAASKTNADEGWSVDGLTQDACDEIAAAMGYMLKLEIIPYVGGYLFSGVYFPLVGYGEQAASRNVNCRKDFNEIPKTKRAVAIETLCAAIAHKHGEPK